MSTIDGLDIVSLLLGFALAYAALLSFGRRINADGLPAASRVLVILGLGLLLGYAISEIVHALQAARA